MEWLSSALIGTLIVERRFARAIASPILTWIAMASSLLPQRARPLPMDLDARAPQCVLHYGTGLLASTKDCPSLQRPVRTWDDPGMLFSQWTVQYLDDSPNCVIIQAALMPALALGVKEYARGAAFTNYGREIVLVRRDDPSAVWAILPPQGCLSYLHASGWFALRSLAADGVDKDDNVRFLFLNVKGGRFRLSAQLQLWDNPDSVDSLWRFASPAAAKAYSIMAAVSWMNAECGDFMSVLLPSIFLPQFSPDVHPRGDGDRVLIVKRLTARLMESMTAYHRPPAMRIVKILAQVYFPGPLSLTEVELEDFAAEVVNAEAMAVFPPAAVVMATSLRPSSPRVCELAGNTNVWTAFVDGDPPQTWWFAVHQGYEWCSLDGRTVQKRLTPALRDDIDVVMPSAASASQQ